MASYARRFVLHNVRVVGGCCGTTPEHIRQIKAAVARRARRSDRWRTRTAGDRGRRADAAAPARRRPIERVRRFRASRSRGSPRELAQRHGS